MSSCSLSLSFPSIIFILLLWRFLLFPTVNRIFKKTSKRNKFTVYLGKRDFYEQDGLVDSIDGMIKLHSPIDEQLPIFAMVHVDLDYGSDAVELLGTSLSTTLYSVPSIVPSTLTP
eukprot:m.185725 g.185725  ORF g.185725 m.185725 type:complete len:116 (-) comp16688_c1_seq9:1259-1606(-)